MSSENVVETTPEVVGAVKVEAVKVEEVKVENVETQTATPQSESLVNRSMLFRHPTEKMLGGVCGGMAEFLGWDPTLVRILWFVATLTTGGGGLLAYLALWLLLPVGTTTAGRMRPAVLHLNERSFGVAAKVLIGLGVLLLLSNLGVLPPLWDGFWTVMNLVFWPGLLIGIGYLLLRGAGNSSEWRINWSGWQNRVRTDVKLPSGSEVKGGLRQWRANFPLKRSRRDRFFMGVCGGLGKKSGIDANLIRLIWVAFSIGSVGMGVLLYVVVGLFLPEEQPLAASQPTSMQDLEGVHVIDGTANYKV